MKHIFAGEMYLTICVELTDDHLDLDSFLTDGRTDGRSATLNAVPREGCTISVWANYFLLITMHWCVCLSGNVQRSCRRNSK